MTNIVACHYCKKPPGTKEGPPKLVRCLTEGCNGRNFPAVTVEDWNRENTPRLVRVDTNISDLFFNTDLDSTKLYDKGQFTGYDENKLKEEAQTFLSCLDRLGVATPSVEDLIADYYGRI